MLSRRGFLGSLLGVGASWTLSGRRLTLDRVLSAPEPEVQEMWTAAIRAPHWLEVGTDRAIVDVFDGPRVRRDVFEGYFSPQGWRSTLDVERELEWGSAQALNWRFTELASELAEGRLAQELEELEIALEGDEDDDDGEVTTPETTQGVSSPSGGSAHMRARIEDITRSIDALLDPDDGWKAWVRYVGRDGLDIVRAEAERWLDEDIVWNELEMLNMTEEVGSQGRVYVMFREMDFATCRALGVKVVEGEHPGSTYYAAELMTSVEAANEAAARMELPIRFRSV